MAEPLALADHLIEEHGVDPALRLKAFDRGALQSAHWVKHQRDEVAVPHDHDTEESADR